MTTQTCIVCEKNIISADLIEKYEESFCSQTCLDTYEAELKKVGDNMHLDDCC